MLKRFLNAIRIHFNEKNKERELMKNFGAIAQINGRFALYTKDGTFVQDYARRRDALRGATRRGINIA